VGREGSKQVMSIVNDEWHAIIQKSVYDALDDGNLHLCMKHFQVQAAFLKGIWIIPNGPLP